MILLWVKHTQLDGAVISSTAETKNNQLDTGTLGFSDIHNYAEYKVEHQSGGVSTSGSVESNMLANMGHALAMAGNHSDSAENITQSAVSQGNWTIRDSDNQQQNIAQLSQDTDNAHSTLNKIFDKEKEQNRQQKQQLVGEIGAQIIDLATTVDTIRGTNIAKEESTLNRLSDTAYDNIYQALSETKDNVTERDVQNYLFQQRLQDHTNQSDFGTGGKYTRAIQAVTAFTQGMMGNNIVTAIANGSAPYLTNEVKNQIQGNSVESDIQRTLAHGLVNAGLALAKGENVVAQATGAMTGETIGILSHSLYGKTPEELSESEKQNISAWATLASGIAGGLISDNSTGVANAAQAGKVVVENNVFGPKDLPSGMADYGQAMSSLAISMARNEHSIEEINTALTRAAKGIHPEGQDPALGIMIAWGNITGIPLDVFLMQQEMTPEKAAEIVGNTPPTTTAKALQFIAAKTYLAFVKNGGEMPNWDTKKGEYSFKYTGKVPDVKHPNGLFDGDLLLAGQVNETSNLIPRDLINKITEHNTQLGILNRKQGTISGAHKQGSFLESVEMIEAKVNLTITDKKYPGLIEYKYQIPAVNGRGQQIGFKAEQTKTTYDPAILPDSKINDMSYKASQKAASFFKDNPDYRQYSAQIDGYWFQVTRDARTGEINNAFITMPPRGKK